MCFRVLGQQGCQRRICLHSAGWWGQVEAVVTLSPEFRLKAVRRHLHRSHRFNLLPLPFLRSSGGQGGQVDRCTDHGLRRRGSWASAARVGRRRASSRRSWRIGCGSAWSSWRSQNRSCPACSAVSAADQPGPLQQLCRGAAGRLPGNSPPCASTSSSAADSGPTDPP